jgi:hypothetical protein
MIGSLAVGGFGSLAVGGFVIFRIGVLSAWFNSNPSSEGNRERNTTD